MKKSDFTYEAADGKEIFASKWEPDEGLTPRGLIQIIHGMAEHRHRYDEFAAFLTAAGYICFAEDHRGHGQTIATPSEEGYFAESAGWYKTLTDIVLLSDMMKKDYPELPLILFGHSMGSFFARTYMIKHPEQVRMAIISGTAAGKGWLGTMGKVIAEIQSAFLGKKAKSPLLDSLSFGAFNGFFKPNRTKFDWLSRDEKKVDEYISDPACGFVCTTSFFKDLLTGLSFVNTPAHIHRLPKELPILLIAGGRDPVSNMGKGVKEVYTQYKTAGLKDVEIKLYPEARHEILNEINRVEVYDDILAWIEKQRGPVDEG